MRVGRRGWTEGSLGGEDVLQQQVGRAQRLLLQRLRGKEAEAVFFVCLFFFVKCRVNMRGVKTGSPSLS